MPEDPNNNQLDSQDLDAAGTNAPVSFQDNSNFASNPVDSNKTTKPPKSGGGFRMPNSVQNLKQQTLEAGRNQFRDTAVKKLSEQLAKHPQVGQDVGKMVQGLGTSGRKGDKLIDEGAQKLAKRGLENVVKAGAKGAVKAGSSEIANQVLPGIGAISATDAVRGTLRGIRQGAEGHLVKGATTAVKGVATSLSITIFNLSIQWWIFGPTIGLSFLLVGLPIGNVLLFTSNRGMTVDKKMLIIGADILLFFFWIACVLGVIVMMCSGLNGAGLALKLASYVSDSANSANEVCKTFSIFNLLSGGFGK